LNDSNPGKYIFSWYNGTAWTNSSAASYSNGQEVSVIKTIAVDTGVLNWTWYFNDSVGNLNQTYIWGVSLVQDNAAGLAISCEAGGPYQQGAEVLVQGNVSNSTSVISNNTVILGITNISGQVIISNVTTSSLGTFQSSFSGLSAGAYILNTSVTNQGFTQTCADSFQIGGRASLVLGKTVSLSSLTNESASYDIILNVINIGLSDAIDVILTDSDSNESPYDLSIVYTNSSTVRSYTKSFERNSSTYELNISIASLNATDSYSGEEIMANSSQIVIVVPSYENQELILIKNVYYNSENSTYVNYTVSVDIINSGGADLRSIVLIDSDLGLSESISLPIGENYSYNNFVLVEKAASNTNKLFTRASAITNGTTYQSNQIRVRIPGYGGPADAIVNAPASVTESISFDTTITVENQNLDIGQDFVIDYWITNDEETANYSSGQQTIYVAASGSSSFIAQLTAPSSAGNYRLNALVSWAGGSATAYDSFAVTATNEEEEEEPTGGGGSALVITGNVLNEIVCDSPYIRHGVECCLDTNINKICDSDENVQITSASAGGNKDGLIRSNQTETKTEASVFSFISKQVKAITSVNHLPWLLLIILVALLIFARDKLLYLFKTISTKAYLVFESFKNFILSLTNRYGFWKKKNPGLMTNLYGIKVYSSLGECLGKVKEIYLENSGQNVCGYMVKLRRKLAILVGRKFALIKHDAVMSIGEVMILKKDITYFEDADNFVRDS
jgi:sporulation protein YlmC with PRC-barrel domain